MKKGFTLVELLASIVIVMILGVLIVPKTLQIINDSKNKGYKETEARLKEAAGKYVIEQSPVIENDTITITKEELMDKHYISEIYDLTDGTPCSAYVVVTNLNTTGVYTPHINCNNYSS